MNCPKCNLTLVMSERLGIEIDYCPQCRGIWLDRCELDKIIERSVLTQVQSNYNPHNHMDDSFENKQQDYSKHRKKGWLNELFD